MKKNVLIFSRKAFREDKRFAEVVLETAREARNLEHHMDMIGDEFPDYNIVQLFTYEHGSMRIEDFRRCPWDSSADAFAAVKKAMSYVTDTKVVENEFAVTISPNPIEDFVNLSLNNVKGDVEFTIYDVHGRLISQENFKAIETHQVDFRKMVSGVYFYEVRNGKNVVQGKLIRR